VGGEVEKGVGEMSRWQQQYHRLRDELLEKLGGKCSLCPSTKDLHFDHINGRDWEPRELSSHNRIRRYQEEAKKGLIRILCLRCNSKYRPGNG
jgi:5-methylcytosine-specific restriction endonuclease McrA